MKIVSDFPHEYLFLPEWPLGLEVVVKSSEYRVSNNFGLVFRRFHEHGILINHIEKTGTDLSSLGLVNGGRPSGQTHLFGRNSLVRICIMYCLCL